MFDPSHDLAPTRISPASRLHAWLDICQMATHKPRQTAHSGTLQVGEMVASLRTLGSRWKWSKDKVRRFVRELEVSTRIATVRETPAGTVYSVVNYSTYAAPPTKERDTLRDKERDRGETGARQEQPLNHSTKQKREPSGNGVAPTPTASFDDFWKVAVRRVGKLAAERSFKKAIKRKDADTLMERWAAYNAGLNGDLKFEPHPATWLNQGRWLDDAPKEPELGGVVDEGSTARWIS